MCLKKINSTRNSLARVKGWVEKSVTCSLDRRSISVKLCCVVSGKASPTRALQQQFDDSQVFTEMLIPHVMAGLPSTAAAGSSDDPMNLKKSRHQSPLSPMELTYCDILVKQGMTVYACKYGDCKMFISGRTQFRRHLRTHTGEKPFQCQYCDYKSSRKGNLKQHVYKRHIEGLQVI